MERDYKVTINLSHLMSEVHKGRGIRARDNACRELTAFVHEILGGNSEVITYDYKSVLMTAEQFANFIALRAAAGCKNGILDLNITRIPAWSNHTADYDMRRFSESRNAVAPRCGNVSINITNLNEGDFKLGHSQPDTAANSMISQTAKNIDRIDALLTRLHQAPTFEIAGVSLMSKALLPVVLVERQEQVKEMSKAIKDSYADVQKSAMPTCTCKNC